MNELLLGSSSIVVNVDSKNKSIPSIKKTSTRKKCPNCTKSISKQTKHPASACAKYYKHIFMPKSVPQKKCTVCTKSVPRKKCTVCTKSISKRTKHSASACAKYRKRVFMKELVKSNLDVGVVIIKQVDYEPIFSIVINYLVKISNL